MIGKWGRSRRLGMPRGSDGSNCGAMRGKKASRSAVACSSGSVTMRPSKQRGGTRVDLMPEPQLATVKVSPDARRLQILLACARRALRMVPRSSPQASTLDPGPDQMDVLSATSWHSAFHQSGRFVRELTRTRFMEEEVAMDMAFRMDEAPSWQLFRDK